MVTIHKYPLKIDREQQIETYEGARFTCVMVQKNAPCLWAIVDTRRNKHNVNVHIRGTGHDLDGLDSNTSYVGSFFLHYENFVGHVFIQ